MTDTPFSSDLIVAEAATNPVGLLPAPLDGAPGVGRALVDGAYAAMRAAAREGAW